MSRILLALTTLLLLRLCLPAPCDEPTNKYALLVGIDKYEHEDFSPLDCAERDVLALARQLDALDFSTTVMLGSESGAKRAMRSEIQSAIDTVLKGVTRRDVVLVCFAGHGVQVSQKDPLGTSAADAYFCPVDARPDNMDTLLRLGAVLDRLQVSGGARNVVLVDACRSVGNAGGRGVRRVLPGIQGRTSTFAENTAVFYSCRAGQTSLEDPKGLGHGLFTFAMLEALKQQAERDEELSWFALVSKVSRQFRRPEIVQILTKAGCIQEPILAGNMQDFLLRSSPSTVDAPIAQDNRTALRSLTGVWKGNYSYPEESGRGPVPFIVLAVQQGNMVTGVLREPNTFGDAGNPFLYASILGKFENGQLQFEKTYDGTASVAHGVKYSCRIPDDQKTSEAGTWSIPNSWSGTFTLHRQDPSQYGKYTGVWDGDYSYPVETGQKNVAFQLTLFQIGQQITGFIKEPNTFGNPANPWLYATFQGTINESTKEMVFRKTYDGTGDVVHSVEYRGRVGENGLDVPEGRWTIGEDAGAFAMQRSIP